MRFERIPLILALFVLLTVSGCGGTSGEEEVPQAEESSDSGGPGSSILKIGDKLFNLPSPLETAFLIEEVGGHFSETLLNPSIDPTQYSTRSAQAMNLGIYGADLGYSLIYGQSQQAFKLMATCKKLSGELGISPTLYTSMIKRFEGNLENRDSLLRMVSELNRLSDEYLKENESEDISALILYGGWVESLYFTTSLTNITKDERLRTRVGEQKNSLKNMIALLEQVNADGSLKPMIEDLKGLQAIFDKVDYTYEWVEPATDPTKKLTVIKSKSNVVVGEELLAEITEKVTAIRNNIIGA